MAGDLYWAIIIASREFEESLGILNFSNMNYREVNIGWRPRDLDWVKMNVDGAAREDGTIAGYGGLIRTAAEEWVIGFNMGLGVADSLSAEI